MLDHICKSAFECTESELKISLQLILSNIEGSAQINFSAILHYRLKNIFTPKYACKHIFIFNTEIEHNAAKQYSALLRCLIIACS